MLKSFKRNNNQLFKDFIDLIFKILLIWFLKFYWFDFSTLNLTPWSGETLSNPLSKWVNMCVGSKLSLFGDLIPWAILDEFKTATPKLFVWRLLLLDPFVAKFLSLTRKPNFGILIGDVDPSLFKWSLESVAKLVAELHNDVVTPGSLISRCVPFSVTIYKKTFDYKFFI